MSYNYNPQPPRVWSRVQSGCSTSNDSNNNNTISSEIDMQMLLKGNILQYKKKQFKFDKKSKIFKNCQRSMDKQNKNVGYTIANLFKPKYI